MHLMVHQICERNTGPLPWMPVGIHRDFDAGMTQLLRHVWNGRMGLIQRRIGHTNGIVALAPREGNPWTHSESTPAPPPAAGSGAERSLDMGPRNRGGLRLRGLSARRPRGRLVSAAWQGGSGRGFWLTLGRENRVVNVYLLVVTLMIS